MEQTQNSDGQTIARRDNPARPPVNWYLLRPLFWPRWLRRAALICFPVSLPCVLFLLATMPIWSLVGNLLQRLGRGLDKIWNARQRTARHAPYSIF